MTNLGRAQPAEPDPELVMCAIAKVVELANSQGVSAEDIIRLLDAGMQMSDFLTAIHLSKANPSSERGTVN